MIATAPLVGEQAQPVELPDFGMPPAEHAEDAEYLITVDQRMPGKAPNLLPPDPFAVDYPLRVRSNVRHENRFASCGYQSDFAGRWRHVLKAPSKRIQSGSPGLRGRPALAASWRYGLDGGAGTENQILASA